MEDSNQLWKLMGEKIFLSGLKSVMVVVITARRTCTGSTSGLGCS